MVTIVPAVAGAAIFAGYYELHRRRKKMAKRTAVIVADDGKHKLTITVESEYESGWLGVNETTTMMRKTVRQIASVLPNVPYSDFGIDNTKIGDR